MAVNVDLMLASMVSAAALVLELEPTEADWFPVWMNRATPYKQYSESKTGTESFRFTGNFVLLRFRKTRSYLTNTSSIGDITKVMLSV